MVLLTAFGPLFSGENFAVVGGDNRLQLWDTVSVHTHMITYIYVYIERESEDWRWGDAPRFISKPLLCVYIHTFICSLSVFVCAILMCMRWWG